MTAVFNPALIIVDIQEDFLPPNGSLAVNEGRKIIPKILDLLDLKKFNWKAIIATKDWHPANHVSFASNSGQEPFTTKTFNHPTKGSEVTKEQVLWPEHAIQNTFGSAFPEEFAIVFNQMLKDQPIPVALKQNSS
ncbi:unnamed protein product [Ambrosiozyma monospora]|uniref:Unnamed protein product n=1 Tax=Ambrosiozyma monospora TaxID=43982 RepID=A0ACB5U5L9_AMBMO|nr:unnamed protein product [Ambrosiozyma monospora]